MVIDREITDRAIGFIKRKANDAQPFFAYVPYTQMHHPVDLFPTLAQFVGGEIPRDRVLDGVDQSDFFMGASGRSARDSIVIYVGNELFGVKWRNWKMLMKELEEGSFAVRKMAYPSVYNLIADPKEEEPLNFYLIDSWVDVPLGQVMEDHEASIAADPGAPGG